MSKSSIGDRERVGRPPTPATRCLRPRVWAVVGVLVWVLAIACSGKTVPAETPLWDEARWDIARWVTPDDGTASAIAAGNELDAEPLRLALASVEDDVATLRDLVIEVRRTQVGVRDRVAALEAWASMSSLGTTAAHAGGGIRSLESVAGAGLEAGSVASSGSLNGVFNLLASDLGNIHEFMLLLELDSDAIGARLTAVEDAVDFVAVVVDDPTPFDVESPVIPHAFVTRTVMHAGEMNENLAAVAVTADLLDAADEMMSRLVDVFLVRIVALEDVVDDAP